ncbi:hypothetical protein EZ456_02195 [Pedobacter psychrodurus]|uniref:Uncharacterized protein n=1 Tax=Pedobacter psychrodurus TaxID=2530456 RepID=A0A4R0Q037_9SPHI|nr:hypothetical protein [Pedobacter psychrodurus]TCD28992.1 hypothetical protein EZ456_02195 [Pedobacter psychrodurus]
MKINIRPAAVILLLLISFSLTKAQNAARTDDPKYLKKKIDSIFIKTFNDHILKDSIAIYAINFKLEIVKNEKGKAILANVTANEV